MISEDEKFRKLFRSMPRYKTPDKLISKVYNLIKNDDVIKERERMYDLFNIKIRRLKISIAALAVILAIVVPIMLFFIKPAIPTNSKPIYMVKFVYKDSTAKNVNIVGDFNGWDKDGTPMRKIAGTDLWVADITLKSGTYRYNFLVNGNQWAVDPFSNIKIKDKFGNESSVIVLLQPENKGRKL